MLLCQLGARLTIVSFCSTANNAAICFAIPIDWNLSHYVKPLWCSAVAWDCSNILKWVNMQKAFQRATEMWKFDRIADQCWN